jgi:hypothetical protein
MNIDVNSVLAEARAMALELRLKDRAIMQLEARIAQLEAQAKDDETV